MGTTLTCSRCFRVISPDDVVEFDVAALAHVDCRRPQDLTHAELSLLYSYCWLHPVDCPACGQSSRHYQLRADPFGNHKSACCPHCQLDLTEIIRGHLYTCPMSPDTMRRKARETRETSRRLVKRSDELMSRADLLVREAEVAVAALRDAIQESAPEALRLLIRARLRDGGLPRDGLSAPSPGGGDCSTCAACEHVVTARDSMMVVIREVSPFSTPAHFPLHVGCFQIWSQERQTFKPDP